MSNHVWACLVADGKPITIGENCIVMENAVLRSTDEHAMTMGNHCLVGPHSHIVGCIISDCVFLAIGVSVFHGASIGSNAEVQVNGILANFERLTQPPKTG